MEPTPQVLPPKEGEDNDEKQVEETKMLSPVDKNAYDYVLPESKKLLKEVSI
jgi:hypothetical protein